MIVALKVFIHFLKGASISLMRQRLKRDSAIDILRGIAIITMIFANLMGSTLAEPHALALRAAGSFAAPLFIFLAGMMVGRGIELHGHAIGYFTRRGLFLILIAAIVCDMLIWGVVPLLNMEVLYLIGLSLPVAALMFRRSLSVQLFVVIAIFSMTPLLQSHFGYKPGVFGYFIPKNQATLDYLLSDLPRFLHSGYFKQIFIDGWFPVFPWIGFALLGALIGKIRWTKKRQTQFDVYPVLLGSMAFITLGLIVWINHPGALYVRLGFSELFYPPTLGYSLTAIGVIALLFWVADRTTALIVWRPVKILGESALFLYVFHWILIDHVIDRFAQQIGLQSFLLWFLLLLGICFAVAGALLLLRKKWLRMPAAFRFILG